MIRVQDCETLYLTTSLHVFGELDARALLWTKQAKLYRFNEARPLQPTRCYARGR